MRMITPFVSTLVAVGAVVAGGCGDLTRATNSGIVQPSSLNNAVGAAAWYAGATASVVGNAQTAIVAGAVFSDEWIDADFPGNSPLFWADSRRPVPVTFQ